MTKKAVLKHFPVVENICKIAIW